jgi:hypothetical protein
LKEQEEDFQRLLKAKADARRAQLVCQLAVDEQRKPRLICLVACRSGQPMPRKRGKLKRSTRPNNRRRLSANGWCFVFLVITFVGGKNKKTYTHILVRLAKYRREEYERELARKQAELDAKVNFVFIK